MASPGTSGYEGSCSDLSDFTTSRASAAYNPSPSDSVLSILTHPGTSAPAPTHTRPVAGYLAAAGGKNRSSGQLAVPDDSYHVYFLLLLQFELDRISENCKGAEHGRLPESLDQWLDWQRFTDSLPSFGRQKGSRAMNWPPIWVDPEGNPVYQLDGSIPFQGPHPSTRNLPIPPEQLDDAFPSHYAYSPDLDTQPRPTTRRGSYGVDDDGGGHPWAARPSPHTSREPSGDAQHYWQLNTPRRYIYGCSLSVVEEEGVTEEDSGVDLSEQSSADSASSGLSTESASSAASATSPRPTFSNQFMTNSLSSGTSPGSPTPNNHSPGSLYSSHHLPTERRLSADLLSDDEYYDAPSHLGSPFPDDSVDWSSEDGYESAEAGSDDSVFDAEICEAVHCHRDSMYTDDGSRFSIFSDSRRPSLATDTSSRRPSFATAHESVFGSRRPSFATSVPDEAIADDDEDVSPVSPTTGDMLINIWRSKRSSMLFIDPSAPLPLPSSTFLDTPVSPRVPPSPGAASFMSAARPESVLLPDDADPETYVTESPQQLARTFDSDSEEEAEDLDETLATLKEFEAEPASIACVTARVYLEARIAPAQLVYYDLMLAASETAQHSRQARGIPASGSKRRGTRQAIKVPGDVCSRPLSARFVR